MRDHGGAGSSTMLVWWLTRERYQVKASPEGCRKACGDPGHALDGATMLARSPGSTQRRKRSAASPGSSTPRQGLPAGG